MITLQFDGEERSFQTHDRLVVFVFGASWCQPCTQLTKQLQDIERVRSNIVAVKIDIEVAPKAAETYGVKSLPTVVLLRGGTVLCSHAGMLSKTALLELIDEH